MKIDSWAMSAVSVLSSTENEYVMKSFHFATSWYFSLVESCRIRSTTVFLVRLTLENDCLFFWAHHRITNV